MVLTLTTVLLNSRRDKPFKVNKCHQINNSHRCSGVLVSFLFSPDALVSMNSCRLKIHIRTTSVMEVFGCMYVSVNLNMCFFSMSKQMSAFASVRVTCMFVYAFTNVQSQGLHFTFNSLSFPTPSPCWVWLFKASNILSERKKQVIAEMWTQPTLKRHEITLITLE